MGLALARGLLTKHAIKGGPPSNQGIDIDAAPPHFVPYVVGFRASKIDTIRKVTLFWPFVRPELFFRLPGPEPAGLPGCPVKNLDLLISLEFRCCRFAACRARL